MRRSPRIAKRVRSLVDQVCTWTCVTDNYNHCFLLPNTHTVCRVWALWQPRSWHQQGRKWKDEQATQGLHCLSIHSGVTTLEHHLSSPTHMATYVNMYSTQLIRKYIAEISYQIFYILPKSVLWTETDTCVYTKIALTLTLTRLKWHTDCCTQRESRGWVICNQRGEWVLRTPLPLFSSICSSSDDETKEHAAFYVHLHCHVLQSESDMAELRVVQPGTIVTWANANQLSHAYNMLTLATCSCLCVVFLLRVIVIFQIFLCFPIHCFPGTLLALINSQFSNISCHVYKNHGNVSGGIRIVVLELLVLIKSL